MWCGLLGTMGSSQRLDLMISEGFSNCNDSVILWFILGVQNISWKLSSVSWKPSKTESNIQMAWQRKRPILYINLSSLICWNFIDIHVSCLYGVEVLLKKHFLHRLLIWDNWKCEKICLIGIFANLIDKIICSRLEVSSG